MSFEAPLPPVSPAQAAASMLRARKAPRGYPLTLTFTGSGGEYFRIWARDVLLTLVTLGGYLPWATVRRLRYFHLHTQLGGHAFDFDGAPWSLYPGLVPAIALMLVALAVPPRLGESVVLIGLGGATTALVLATPALLRGWMRFRFQHTRWRGLRFHFTGTRTQARRALLPAALAAVLVPGLGASGQAGWALAGGLSCLALLGPLLLFRLARLRHDHFVWAGVRTRLRTGPGAFYERALPGLLLVPGATLFILGAGGGLPPFEATTLFPLNLLDSRDAAAILAAAGVAGGSAILARALLTATLQNLTWNRTKSRHLRFESRLRTNSLLALTLKNTLLTMLTLGLYRPFAVVAVVRLRLESVTVFTRLPLEELLLRRRGKALVHRLLE